MRKARTKSKTASLVRAAKRPAATGKSGRRGAPQPDETPTRDRILLVAKDLFYREGIRSVGVDAIVKAAGITKPTLYYYFRSKDALVVAYLDERNRAILASLQKTFQKTRGTIAEKIAAVFASVAARTPNPKWKGCPIVRGAAEFAADPGHEVRLLASRHKKSVEAWFQEMLAGEKIPDAPLKARQLAVLLDGAVTQAFLHGDPEYARVAGAAVRPILQTRA
jgi:AcrR family transcriptional regulator